MAKSNRIGEISPVALLAFALVSHLWIYGDSLNPDTTTYMEVTQSILTRGSIRIETTLVPRHPPMGSFAFVPFALFGGVTEASVHTFQLVIFAIDVLALYALSARIPQPFRNLPALLLVLDPVVYLDMSEGRTLVLLILFTLVTLWGIWRGLADSRWFLVAGIGASLAYLTTDSVGYLFLVAAAAGFLWRFSAVRWRVLRDRGYLGAATVFGGTVLLWTTWNWLTTGTPYTDPRIVGYLTRLLTATPVPVAFVLSAGLTMYFFAYLFQTLGPFFVLKSGRSALARLPALAIANPHVGAMALFVATAVVISSVVAAALILYEPLRSLGSADTYLRYAVVVAPIVYLGVGAHAVRVARFPRRPWILALLLCFLILAAQFVPQAMQRDRSAAPFHEVAEELSRRGLYLLYSDVAVYLRYNVPEIGFVSVDKGYSTRYVNVTLTDVPAGASLLTFIYIPPVYDAKIQGFYIVESFDPSVHNPLLNTFYRE